MCTYVTCVCVSVQAKKTTKPELRDAVVEWERALVDAHGRGADVDGQGEDAPAGAAAQFGAGVAAAAVVEAC